MIINEHLHDKYHTDEPDPRWRLKVGEYHASQVFSCVRKHYWDYTTEYHPPGASSFPYFELGNTLEDFYGEALRSKFGNEYVLQDVMIEVNFTEDVTLTGESDWSVLKEPLAEETERLEYITDPDGTITEERTRPNGTVVECELDGNTPPLVKEVFETKTTREISWKRKNGYDQKHRYQLSSYMNGMGGVPGRIVYMKRDDLDEIQFEFDPDPSVWLDVKYRVLEHHRNLVKDALPDTKPVHKMECKWCHYKDECVEAGGSIWR